MSSEDSRMTNSSRLSQFGIYRSIDARTEEFLRLSRKRQIRQGCACAAISTAITVTIVITVLLVYEYTMNLESNPAVKTRMSAWHSMFNDTSPFEVKYNKAKINIDPTTLKLLPLVLKALNQNRYLEKFIENSNLETELKTEGKKDPISLDHSFKRNLFHGTKIKPTQTVHTTDFKTTHALGYKTTFNNLDYYKKIRQENDNNRMLHYFDKMTSVNTFDSSGSNSFEMTNTLTTEPIYFKEDNLAIKPKDALSVIKMKENNKISSTNAKNTTDIKKTSKQDRHTTKLTTIQPLPSISLDELDTRSKSNFLNRVSKKSSAKLCKCSKTLAILLSKLLIDIQNIIPQIELYKKSCSDNIEPFESTTTLNPLAVQTISKKKFKNPTFKFVKNKSISTYKPRVKSNTTDRRKVFNRTIKLDTKLHNHFNLLKQIKFGDNTTNITTTIKTYIEPTYNTEPFKGVSTEPMNKAKNENIWKHILNKYQRELHKHNALTSIINSNMSNVRYGVVNNTDSFQIEEPQITKHHLHFSNESTELLNFIDNDDVLLHTHDNGHTLPLSGVLRKNSFKEKQKHKTASIVEWFNKLKSEKKDKYQYKFNIKEENKPTSHIPVASIEPKINVSISVNKKQIEPKIYNNLNVLNEIKYLENKNATHKRKIIYPIWPEQDENSKINISNITVIPIKVIEPSDHKSYGSGLTVIHTRNLNRKTNATELDNNKEKTKRNSKTKLQNTTLNDNHEIRNQQEVKINGIDNNQKLHKTKTTSFEINSTTSLPSRTRIFISKFAEINDLLYQTKNISNTTIYEKFNSGHNINQTDDNNILATLEYDEFKFLNDEMKERENTEVRFSEIEKYKTVQSNYENSDDSTKFIKSMLPISRPVFLEIQRNNDWKHDNSNREQDYGYTDNNFE